MRRIGAGPPPASVGRTSIVPLSRLRPPAAARFQPYRECPPNDRYVLLQAIRPTPVPDACVRATAAAGDGSRLTQPERAHIRPVSGSFVLTSKAPGEPL
ncbi:hypothetical protein SAMN05216276_102823 [Streptosporangium subroseum]|uniref:Uncharacterized protein n=1 Tax=Streptosporangium subroseum TaxID=106412 RepID=A0A239KR28_9ACTN|nr:hypothetical protein [Streptosporangium subroseum]SNT19654.1 hypothetical protein SAMN05216276_102823 [Streptosporangium subroseum]